MSPLSFLYCLCLFFCAVNCSCILSATETNPTIKTSSSLTKWWLSLGVFQLFQLCVQLLHFFINFYNASQRADTSSASDIVTWSTFNVNLCSNHLTNNTLESSIIGNQISTTFILFSESKFNGDILWCFANKYT